VIDNLALKYSSCSIIEPWILFTKYWQGSLEAISEIFESVDNLLTNNPKDWIAIELYSLKAEMTQFFRGESDPGYVPRFRESMKICEKAEEAVNTSSKLKCFLPYIGITRADYYYSLGDLKSSLEQAEIAYETAKEIGDILFQGRALEWMAIAIKNSDPTQAIELVTKGNEIFERLQYRMGIIDFLAVLGNIFEITGDFDQAIECYRHSLEILEFEKVNTSIIRYDSYYELAKLFINLNQGEDALELLEHISEEISLFLPWIHFAKAEALALCGRPDEAADNLDIGGDALFRGNFPELVSSLYYSSRGFLERERGDAQAAIRSFKRALKICEQNNYLVLTLPNLIRVIEMEMIVFNETNNRDNFVNAQLLLSRLEQLAHEQNLYSTEVRVAILKADLHKIGDRRGESLKILERALELTQSSSMKALREEVKESLEHLDSNKSRTEMVQKISSRMRSLYVPPTQTKEIPFTILGCIVLLRDGGIEIFSKYIDEKLTSDPSMVAGLISAVSTFTSELTEDSRGELQSIVHQDIAVLLEHGQQISCALLSDKDTYNARVLQRRFLEKFEEDYSDSLVRFDGGISVFKDADEIFEKMLSQ